MKQTASEDYCPATNLLQLRCPVLLTLQTALSLVQMKSHSFFFLGVNSGALSKSRFFLAQNVLHCALGRTRKADTPEFPATIIFVSTTKWNGRLCTRKCLACLYEHLGTGFDSFLNRKVTCTDNKWWRETQRRDREGGFYRLWCEMLHRKYELRFCSCVYIQKT
jgi:hypothetical protein